MNRYLEYGNLIVRTDSFDKLKELSEQLLKKERERCRNKSINLEKSDRRQ